MTQSDLLDILISAIILLIALIGLWQGIGRTLLYLAGAFLGSELALWWADDLGEVLSDFLPLSDPTGMFVAATAMIVASMIVVGAGFSPLIWRYPSEWRNRLGGMLAGLALGAISLGLILRYYFLFLQSEAQSALGDTRVAARLWEDFHWFVLVSALALGLMVVAGWVMGAPGSDRDPEFAAPVRRSAQATPRAPSTESPRFDMESYSAPAGAPLAGIDDTYKPATPMPEPGQPPIRADGEGRSSNGPVPDIDSSQPDEARVSWERADAGLTSVIRDNPDFGVQRSSATEAVTYATEGTAERRESSGMCPNCGMLLRKGDSFCPDCGFPVQD